MSAVVADTHTLIWYLAAPEKLSADAVAALDGATAGGHPIHFSAISLIEISYLVEKGRLPEAFYQEVLDALDAPEAPLVLAPVDRAVADSLRLITRAQVPEMPDRVIAATALQLGLALVTCDLRIRSSPVPTIW